MRESPTSKKVALTLFSQIIRKHPTWIHKIVEHQLMKELIKLLKTERDVAIYMLALMCIISLLPIVPATIAKILQDLFEIFNYLAVWISSNTSNLPECQLIQLQYNLCTLFKRLYGMYPCNFIEFIKVEYVFSKDPSKQTVFNQVISPMLENQRCHPLLLQANKQNELTRWKKAEPHDVVMECARYAIESDRNSSLTTSSLDYSSFISMKTVDFFNSTTPLVDLRHIPNAKSIENKFESIWSPSHVITATPSANTVPNTPTPTPLPPTYGIHHGIEGTSPPTEGKAQFYSHVFLQ
jgi:tuberous sclerosis protein 1